MENLHPIVNADLEAIIASVPELERLRGKTVLITGAAGFIPFYLTAVLLHLNMARQWGIRVLALIRDKAKRHRFAPFEGVAGLEFVVQDVTAPLAITEDVHYVIHGASPASPKFFATDPVGTLDANVVGTRNILGFANAQKSEGVLFLSGGEVYGVPDTVPTRETDLGRLDPLSVRSSYAESKRMGETMCMAFAHQYGVRAIIARLYHTYGPGLTLTDGRVFADFVRDILARRDIVLTSDGSASRTFCYISDAAAGLYRVLLTGAPGAYNISNDRCEITIRGLAELLVGLYPELHLKVIVDETRTPKGYARSPIFRASPCIDKARALGFSPSVGLAEGFRRTIASYR